MSSLFKHSLKRVARFLLPRSGRRLLRSAVWASRDASGRHGLPPAYLRVKVMGGFSPYKYVLGGETDAQALLTAMERADVSLPGNAAVLDFGCGVGRLLLPLHDKVPDARWFGTDIEADLIRWSRRELSGLAQFSVNGKRPPLPYSDAQFDWIYSWSIFTHLDEELQFRWLEELKRVARPGAIILLTVHGESLLPGLPAEHEFMQRGIYFNPDDTWGEYFQDYYHTTFHSRAYIEREWARFFTVLDYWERGQTGAQDIVVLRRE